MICKDISFDRPEENLLYDEVLLHLAERETNEDYLRFWEAPFKFVVLGRISKEEDDLKKETLLHDQIPVLRRSSGGGTVIQGPGCLNYTLVLSKERDNRLDNITASYEYILSKVVDAFRTINVSVQYLPTSDLALVSNQKKFSGNAQKRGKKFILHHGTLLYQFNLQDIEKYLKMPQSMPDYRKDRSHLDFVTNINVTSEDLKSSLSQKFGINQTESSLNRNEKVLLEEFQKTYDRLVHL